MLAYKYRSGRGIKDEKEREIFERDIVLLARAMSAIRNPKAYANETITKEDALRKLAFASMLIYKLNEVK